MRRGANVLKLWGVVKSAKDGKDCEVVTAYTKKEGDGKKATERRPEGTSGLQIQRSGRCRPRRLGLAQDQCGREVGGRWHEAGSRDDEMRPSPEREVAAGTGSSAWAGCMISVRWGQGTTTGGHRVSE